MNQAINPLELEAEIIYFFEDHGTPFRADDNAPLGIDRSTPLSELGIDEIDMNECLMYLEEKLFGESHESLEPFDFKKTASAKLKSAWNKTKSAYDTMRQSHHLDGTVADLFETIEAELRQHGFEAEPVENLTAKIG